MPKGMPRMIHCIQKMTLGMENHFRYFPASPELLRWGAVLTASGFTRVPPGSAYPPAGHPEDHHFDWDQGRIIEALQLVLVSEGSGWLETLATRRRRVEAGMAFLLLPRTWHRYRPDPHTGWVESWIELQGPVIDNLLAARSFPPATVLRRGAIEIGLEEILNAIHRRVFSGSHGIQAELSAAALQALARFSRLPPSGPPRLSAIQRAVHRAEKHLTEHFREPIHVERLAADLGVAYSHFRRAFQAHTGFAPWRYVIQLRLTRARRMLAASDAKLDDIAAQVGFNSGFHLSSAFKQAYGISPDPWRKALRSSAGSPPASRHASGLEE